MQPNQKKKKILTFIYIYIYFNYSTSFGLTINDTKPENIFNSIFIHNKTQPLTNCFKNTVFTFKVRNETNSSLTWTLTPLRSERFPFKMDFIRTFTGTSLTLFSQQLHVYTVQMRQKIKLESCPSSVLRLLSEWTGSSSAEESSGREDALLSGSVETTAAKRNQFRKTFRFNIVNAASFTSFIQICVTNRNKHFGSRLNPEKTRYQASF